MSRKVIEGLLLAKVRKGVYSLISKELCADDKLDTTLIVHGGDRMEESKTALKNFLHHKYPRIMDSPADWMMAEIFFMAGFDAALTPDGGKENKE